MTTKVQERAVCFRHRWIRGYQSWIWWYEIKNDIICLFHRLTCKSYLNGNNASDEIGITKAYLIIIIIMHHLAVIVARTIDSLTFMLSHPCFYLRRTIWNNLISGFYGVSNSSRSKLFNAFGCEIVHLSVEPISLSWPELSLLKMSPNELIRVKTPISS